MQRPADLRRWALASCDWLLERADSHDARLADNSNVLVKRYELRRAARRMQRFLLAEARLLREEE